MRSKKRFYRKFNLDVTREEVEKIVSDAAEDASSCNYGSLCRAERVYLANGIFKSIVDSQGTFSTLALAIVATSAVLLPLSTSMSFF